MATDVATKKGSGVRDLLPKILDLLPGKQADIARALGRKPSDGTVRRALEKLANDQIAERHDGIWRRCQSGESLPEPDVPADFDQTSVGLYERTQQALVEQRLWRDSDRPLLESYVRSKQSARKAREEIDGQEYRVAHGGRVFRHPGVEDARQHERDALAFAVELGLTPKARGDRAKSGGESKDPLDF